MFVFIFFYYLKFVAWSWMRRPNILPTIPPRRSDDSPAIFLLFLAESFIHPIFRLFQPDIPPFVSSSISLQHFTISWNILFACCNCCGFFFSISDISARNLPGSRTLLGADTSERTLEGPMRGEGVCRGREPCTVGTRRPTRLQSCGSWLILEA